MKTDRSTVNIIIIAATFVGLLCVAAGVYLLNHKADSATAGILIGVGPMTVTGLFALLAKTSTNDETQPVEVTNPPSDPALVSAVPAPQTDSRGQEATQPVPPSPLSGDEAAGNATG